MLQKAPQGIPAINDAAAVPSFTSTAAWTLLYVLRISRMSAWQGRGAAKADADSLGTQQHGIKTGCEFSSASAGCLPRVAHGLQAGDEAQYERVQECGTRTWLVVVPLNLLA